MIEFAIGLIVIAAFWAGRYLGYKDGWRDKTKVSHDGLYPYNGDIDK